MAATDLSPSGRPLYPPKPKGWRAHSTVISTIVVFGVLAIMPWFPILSFTSIFDTSNSFGAGNLAFVFAFATAFFARRSSIAART